MGKRETKIFFNDKVVELPKGFSYEIRDDSKVYLFHNERKIEEYSVVHFSRSFFRDILKLSNGNGNLKSDYKTKF